MPKWQLGTCVSEIIESTEACIAKMSMLKSISVDKNFQTWLLIGWKHSGQPVRSYVRKYVLTTMDINIDFSSYSWPLQADKYDS